MQEKKLNIYSVFEKSSKPPNYNGIKVYKGDGMMHIFCINKPFIQKSMHKHTTALLVASCKSGGFWEESEKNR